jgi:hypothetical protein
VNSLSSFDGQLIDGLQFCINVYTLLEAIRSRPNGISDLRMRSTQLEKKLIEELIPICKYIQSNYRAGRYINVCWAQGNQQYDAILDQKGFLVEQGIFPERSYLEITCAMHPNEFLGRERLERDGFFNDYTGLSRKKDRSIESAITVYRDSSFIIEDAEYISKCIRKKCDIDYPDNTTLVIQSSLSTIYGSHEWGKLVEYIKTDLPNFKFDEIFIYDDSHHYTHSFFRARQ